MIEDGSTFMSCTSIAFIICNFVVVLQDKIREDEQGKCFICSFGSDEFDRNGKVC